MPRGANLQKLAEVLGVSIAYLSNDEIVDPLTDSRNLLTLRVLGQSTVREAPLMSSNY